jgi:hypothetical protein
LPPHRLAWLDHESGEVSGGRGFARRVARGNCRWITNDASAQPESKRLFVSATHASQDFRLMPTEDGWIALAGE